MRAFVITLFLLGSSSFAFAAAHRIATTETSYDLSFTQPVSPSLQAATYDQKVDHFDGSAQTFAQRYWINSDYATQPATAPVIYHICGEGACDQGYFLNDNAIEWAKALGAHIVYLEHRYYGQSIPTPDLAAENMKYLTRENVMADLSEFQKWISNKNGWHGQWIVVGGSYSGTLSAMYRQRFPDLVVGALAASAPMIPGKGELVGDQTYVSELSSSAVSDDRSWVYQACRDFDFWMATGGSIDSTLMRPSQWLCTTLFGNIPLVNTSEYDQKYNQPFISAAANSPSKILFTYGGADVWTNLGLSQEQNLNAQIQVLVIPNAGHHFDLNAPTPWDSADVVKARETFLNLATQWLQ